MDGPALRYTTTRCNLSPLPLLGSMFSGWRVWVAAMLVLMNQHTISLQYERDAARNNAGYSFNPTALPPLPGVSLGVKGGRREELTPHRHLWADCPENVGASTSHNAAYLHGLLQGEPYLLIAFLCVLRYIPQHPSRHTELRLATQPPVIV
jgi:hypothetical protein